MALTRPINQPAPSSDVMRDLLASARVIAIVGASIDPRRPSFSIASYLKRHGYRILPVNPHGMGHLLHGEPFHASLRDLPGPVDIVNVFRRSDALPEVVEDAIAAKAPALWTQIGVTNAAARQRAEESGMIVVMNRCIRVEHSRLGISRIC